MTSQESAVEEWGQERQEVRLRHGWLAHAVREVQQEQAQRVLAW
jgi:hypothetical protein